MASFERAHNHAIATMSVCTLVAAALMVSLYPLSSLADNSVILSAGAEYRSGDYGMDGDDIEDVYMPVTLDIRADNFVFRATVPYSRVEGPAGSLVSSDATVPGEGRTISRSGIGDVIASFTLQNIYQSRNLALDMTATVKFGNADEDDGLGTGETDYAAQADLYRFVDRGTLFVSLGYKVRGDPALFELEDTWFTSFGGAMFITGDTSAGASLSYHPEVISGGDPSSEFTIFIGHQLTSRTQIRAHILAGLTDASPDWGAGISMRFWMK